MREQCLFPLGYPHFGHKCLMRACHILLLRLIQSGLLASNYASGCECGWCAHTNHNGCSARYIWPTRLGIWGRAVDVEYSRVCVDLNSYNPFHWCAHYCIGSNPWGTQFVLSCWGGNISESSSLFGMRALRPYYRNLFSAHDA